MKREKICGIYKITSPVGRVYIGQSKDCVFRMYNYRNLHCKNQIRLYNSIVKYGWDSHCFEIIHQCQEDNLNYWEKYYVDFFCSFNAENGMNLKDGGNRSKMSKETIEKQRVASTGRKHTEETKRKQSLAKKGIPKSLEHRLSLSIAKQGTKASLVCREKMSFSHKGEKAYWFGKKLSVATKLKISLAKRGEKSFCFGRFGKDHPSFGCNGKLTINTQTGIFYETMEEAANSIDMKWDTFRKKLSGQLKNTTSFIYV